MPGDATKAESEIDAWFNTIIVFQNLNCGASDIVGVLNGTHQSTAIIRSLEQAAEKIRKGGDPQSATKAASRSLTTLGFKVDYVAARNAVTLAIPKSADEPIRLLAAAWMGTTRLIDNIAI